MAILNNLFNNIIGNIINTIDLNIANKVAIGGVVIPTQTDKLKIFDSAITIEEQVNNHKLRLVITSIGDVLATVDSNTLLTIKASGELALANNINLNGFKATGSNVINSNVIDSDLINKKYLDSRLVNKNEFDNGDIFVWQRGDTFSNIISEYVADRWYYNGSGATAQITRETVDTPNSSIGNAIKIDYSADADDNAQLEQSLEGLQQYTNKTFTFSGFIKSDATDLRVNRYYSYGSGGSSGEESSHILDITPSISEWKYFTATFTTPNIDGKVVGSDSYFRVGLRNYANEGAIIMLANLKLEYGSIATPFVSKPYQEELRNCKYYFERIGNDTTYDLIATGFYDTTSEFRGLLKYEPKRTVPSITFSDFSHFLVDGGSNMTLTAISAQEISKNTARVVGVGTTVLKGEGSTLLMQSSLAFVDIDSDI